jgi:hypothetical protein
LVTVIDSYELNSPVEIKEIKSTTINESEIIQQLPFNEPLMSSTVNEKKLTKAEDPSVKRRGSADGNQNFQQVVIHC